MSKVGARKPQHALLILLQCDTETTMHRVGIGSGTHSRTIPTVPQLLRKGHPQARSSTAREIPSTTVETLQKKHRSHTTTDKTSFPKGSLQLASQSSHCLRSK